MKIIPLADRVVIKTVEVEETTKGGLILTGSAKEKPQVAQVVAVGPGRCRGRQGGQDDCQGGRTRCSPASTPAPRSRLTARNAPSSARATSSQSSSKFDFTDFFQIKGEIHYG